MEHRFRLFVYGTLLEGEPDHATLEGATRIGELRTSDGYAIVEMGALAGLVEGNGSVLGELYEVSYDLLAACDRLRDHPRRYHRKTVRLEDGSEAEAYFVHPDQARGLRRVRDGDWRGRFRARRAPEAGPFVRWARARHGKS
ncbi:MAG TPA: gamma-glutamylcyclotransferase family protein [Polyangiaceae bacterium]|nr:gamma-glutamylcyclotransferase family protein [Polyangiaceae bacterium]